MKNIIDVSTQKEIKFTKEDLSILIHGKEHSGASLLSVTIAATLHKAGNKLCIFTAYPMAKEEFLKQILNPEDVFYLEDEDKFNEALKFQTIIVQSGNIDLFINIISKYELMKDRVIFIKNIDTINIPIFKLVESYMLIVSGDFELNLIQQYFKKITYNTKIFLSSMSEEIIPPLEKYQAFVKSRFGEKVIFVQ